MTQTHIDEPQASALELLIAAADAVETKGAHLPIREKRAMVEMLNVVDLSFQTAEMLAGDIDEKTVRHLFLMVTMKLVEVNGLLGNRNDSKAVRSLALISDHKGPVRRRRRPKKRRPRQSLAVTVV